VDKRYDVIVIGAGHAGCEAALAASRRGCRVLLITLNLDSIAILAGSTSFGGPKEGRLLLEIDKLGGRMPVNISKTLIFSNENSLTGSFKDGTKIILVDKREYHLEMKRFLESEPGISLLQDVAVGLLMRENRVAGVAGEFCGNIFSDNVIITTGTFLKGTVFTGTSSFLAGRAGEIASEALAQQLLDLEFRLGRLKVGSGPCIDGETINKDKVRAQSPGEKQDSFSTRSKPEERRRRNCYIINPGPQTYALIKEMISWEISRRASTSLPKDQQQQGCLAGWGDLWLGEKANHQVILEPVGQRTVEMYMHGLTTSLPEENQRALIRTMEGLENAKIMRPGYAVEYDYIPPTQLKLTLETKAVEGLFMAGQVIGTTGYEEAAALGLMAGINAALKVKRKPPFILDRSEAYMGVLVDDLVTKDLSEPYRMYTSREVVSGAEWGANELRAEQDKKGKIGSA